MANGTTRHTSNQAKGLGFILGFTLSATPILTLNSLQFYLFCLSMVSPLCSSMVILQSSPLIVSGIAALISLLQVSTTSNLFSRIIVIKQKIRSHHSLFIAFLGGSSLPIEQGLNPSTSVKIPRLQPQQTFTATKHPKFMSGALTHALAPGWNVPPNSLSRPTFLITTTPFT